MTEESASVTPDSSISDGRVVKLADGDRVLIGRDAGNDIRLAGDLLVSGQHAEIIRRGDRTEIIDRSGSTGLGVYSDGRRVSRAVLEKGTEFSIGRHDFMFDGEWLRKYDDKGAPSLYVDDIDVSVLVRKRLQRRREVLLHDVEVVLRDGTLLGVVGPSGSGKSTLLRAITGIGPATQGDVYFGDRHLYDKYSEVRSRIGLVPQDDAVHRQLKVRRALRFAASLRLAWDVPANQQRARVDDVLKLLKLSHRTNTRISDLSGGERKRTSVALELLTRPSLLVLDEPTSGLDPYLDQEIMKELSLLKKDRIVIVVTHTPLHLELCDHVLIMCQGGRVGYFGPPEGVFGFFGVTSYAEVFREVTVNARYWAQKFKESDTYREHISGPLTQWKAENRAVTETAADASSEPDVATATRTKPVSPPVRLQRPPLWERLRQPLGAVGDFFTLCARMVSVILADRGYTLLLLGLPPLLALLSHTIPGEAGLGPDPSGFHLEAQRLLIVLIIGAAFMGLTNSIREIVKEEQIYRRERSAGLSPTVYLLSKFAVLASIGCLQSIVFARLSILGRGAPVDGLVVGPMLEIMVGVSAVAIASTALGLALGSLVRTGDQATALLVIAVMAQLVLSGALFEIPPGSFLSFISWIDPSRWGFAAVAATTDLNSPIIHDPLWVHEVGAWRRATGVLVLHTAALLGLARLFLRRYEPGRRSVA